MLTVSQYDRFGIGLRCRGLIKSLRVDALTSLISSRTLLGRGGKNYPFDKENSSNRLQSRILQVYAYPAPYKTGAGRCNPKLIKATPDAASVFFVVRYTHHSMVWYAIQQQSYNRRSTAILSYHAAHNGAMCAPYDGLPSGSRSRNRTSRRQRMVTLAGQPQGWPVPFIAGIATPVNVTAPIERCNSRGDSLNQIKEAVYHG
ncbi:hypothetical protein EJO30_23210 [Salmonella enterica subsp. enterica serovar Poona]|nr:hypothetical protein [Salmonella enterica subsp. enterica serovar Poona]